MSPLGWRPWSLKPPHDGETCEEVEEQLDAAVADLNEARAVIVRLCHGRGEPYPDDSLSIADQIRVMAGQEPRLGQMEW